MRAFLRDPFRQPMLALAFMIIVGVAVGCVASGLMPETRSNPVVEVFYSDMPSAHIGERIGHEAIPQEVRIRHGMPARQQRRVVVHELYHAAGFGGHNSNPECYTQPAQGDWPITDPCPEEVAQIQRVRRVLMVKVRDHELEADVDFAIWLWNRAARKLVFQRVR